VDADRPQPSEEPPRRRGAPVLAWLFSTAAGLVAVGFLAVALMVLVLALLL
jgi:hypothetical protein